MATKEAIDEAIAIIENHHCIDNVKRSDITQFVRLSPDSDLSECSFEYAIERLADFPLSEVAKILICSQRDSVLAGRMAEKHGCSVIILPGIDDDYWALCGDYTVVYTMGS